MSKILITGSAHGLGLDLSVALAAAGHEIIHFDKEFGNDVRDPAGSFGPCPDIDVLINCAGVNITGWLENVLESEWDVVMDVNAKGIFKMTQWAQSQLKASRGTVLNVVSNASHCPMTTSAAYNSSKGAAHILTLQLARELSKKDGITVFGISPNKLRGTEMSKDIERQVVQHRGWTPEYARSYQLAALLAGEETDPVQLAEFVAYLLTSKAHHKFLTGCILPYGA